MRKIKKLKGRVKQPSKRTLKNHAWQLFSRFIRLRDCLSTTGTPDRGKCITCGKTFSFKELQAGHFIPGRYYSNLFSEEGCHAQCRACNIWKHGAPLEYRRAILNLYGEGYDLILEKEAQEIKQVNAQDLKDKIEYYRREIKLLEGMG